MKKYFLIVVMVFIQCESQSQNGTISLQAFGPSFTSPIDIANCGDSRLFIAEQDGLIKILNNNGTVNATPFLNITSLTNEDGERDYWEWLSILITVLTVFFTLITPITAEIQ